ncbi:hypothetical protein EVAR_74891_1 [Eumeta japonica]|uniref:Uncharacterized protein n=1 Tax=Eumeta variegata TaxID=151549 RepID=A0A4C1Z423_EUMVA|nr:hypothetical protein EVAR_74891_1 [Eumeta japonica]
MRPDHGETVNGLRLQVLDTLIPYLGHVCGVKQIAEIHGFLAVAREPGCFSHSNVESKKPREDQRGMHENSMVGPECLKSNAALHTVEHLLHAKLPICRCLSAGSVQNYGLYHRNVHGPHDLRNQISLASMASLANPL